MAHQKSKAGEAPLPLGEQLAAIGILIQREHLHHEPPRYYLEAHRCLNAKLGRDILRWWIRHPRNTGPDGWTGKGARAKAEANARLLLESLEEYARWGT